MNLRNPLANVKGLGASGEGSHHWWLQRVTALALIPLSLWFVFSVLNVIGTDHQSATEWIARPGVAVLLMLYLGFMFFHAQLGIQVVLEDYVHSKGLRLVLILCVKAIAIVAGAASVFAILKIAL